MRLRSCPADPKRCGRRWDRRSYIRRAHALLACLVLGLAGCASSQTARERDLRIARARRDVGIDYLSSGRTPLATRELREALQLNPDDPVTILWLGEAYRRDGQLRRAGDILQDGLDLARTAGRVDLVKPFESALSDVREGRSTP